MPTLEQKQTAAKLQEFADFLRDEYLDPDHFDGWPGLPDPGSPVTLRDANFFMLGCCIDLREFSWRAWKKADDFCKKTVPSGHADQMWHWIADHSLEDWNKRKPTREADSIPRGNSYDLHWMKREHERVHRIASALKKHYGGDPRRIWQSRNGEIVLSALEAQLGLGEGIARMILGALRDHGIVQVNASDYKPDRHVCKVMHQLRLSETSRSSDVMKAGRQNFSDPWLVDGALWELGKDDDFKNHSDFEKYYGKMASWKRIKSHVRESVKGMIGELSASVGVQKGWALLDDPTSHWAGIYLVRTEGPLREDMEDMRECELWAWVGVGWYKTLVIAVDVGGHQDYFTDAVLRLCRSTINKKEERQTSSGRWGMREFYDDRQVSEEDLQNRKWLFENLSAQLKRVQGFIMAVEGRAKK